MRNDPEPRGDVHQLGDRFGLHPLHDAGTMEFDSLLDDAEIPGDLLVELAGCQRRQHFALARRKTSKPLPKLRGLARARLQRAAVRLRDAAERPDTA